MFCRKLAGKTIYISGASRGIGKAIALKCARDGANIVIAAKTAEPHPKLPGTIYTAAKESKNRMSRIETIGRASLARENEAGDNWGQEVHIPHVNV